MVLIWFYLGFMHYVIVLILVPIPFVFVPEQSNFIAIDRFLHEFFIFLLYYLFKAYHNKVCPCINLRLIKFRKCSLSYYLPEL